MHSSVTTLLFYGVGVRQAVVRQSSHRTDARQVVPELLREVLDLGFEG